MKTPQRQRGVALITAVLIVALATALAVDVGFKGYLQQRRSASLYAIDQAYQVALGGEAWAADVLQRDRQQGTEQDDFTEEWATPIPPIPIDGGQFEGQLEDLQGRFNINSLVVLDDGQVRTDPLAVKRFERLLEMLELEPRWAAIIADWVDPDGEANFPEGAEDMVYSALTPPYRTANMPITRSSELLAVHEFGLERYRRLEPFITALPIGTPLNLCTASAEVLDSLVEGRREFTNARAAMAQTRQHRCFPNRQEFEQPLSAAQKQELVDGGVIDQTSDYFGATIWVTLGTTRFTLYSLLYRTGGTHLVRPILRSHGTS